MALEAAKKAQGYLPSPQTEAGMLQNEAPRENGHSSSHEEGASPGMSNQRNWFERTFILEPHSPRMETWDLVNMVCLIWTAILAPFEIAFGAHPLDNIPLFVLNR